MPAYRELIDRRCRKSIAICLGFKEREADEFLPAEVRAKLRKVIIDQFNEVASLGADIAESLEGQGGTVLNDLWMERIERIHDAVVGSGGGD